AWVAGSVSTAKIASGGAGITLLALVESVTLFAPPSVVFWSDVRRARNSSLDFSLLGSLSASSARRGVASDGSGGAATGAHGLTWPTAGGRRRARPGHVAARAAPRPP